MVIRTAAEHGRAAYDAGVSDVRFGVSGVSFEVTVPGGILAGVRSGRGDPLLVLHGGPGLSDYSGMFADELTGWDALRYTQRGVDPSTTAGPFTVGQHVSDALAVLDQHGIGTAVVLGHSWGGYLAMQLAAAASLRLSWPSYFADPSVAPAAPDDLRMSRACYAGTYESISAARADDLLPGLLAQFSGPAEIVAGSASPFPANVATSTGALFRDGEVTMVAGAGHFPWIERPGCVAAALRRIAARQP